MNIIKRIFAALMCLIFIISLCSCARKQAGSQEQTTTEVQFLEEYQQYIDNLVDDEEKVYSSATMEDKFQEDKIKIVVKHYYSMQFKEYSETDFLPVKVSEVKDLTYGTGKKVKAKMTGQNHWTVDGRCITPEKNDSKVDTFNQILLITLAEPGKENVLAAIEILEDFDEFYNVSVDGYIGLG
jgi:hypothetical protein